MRVWGPSTPSDSARTTLAPELLGSIPGGELLLDGSPPRSSLEKVRGRGWEWAGVEGAGVRRQWRQGRA